MIVPSPGCGLRTVITWQSMRAAVARPIEPVTSPDPVPDPVVVGSDLTPVFVAASHPYSARELFTSI